MYTTLPTGSVNRAPDPSDPYTTKPAKTVITAFKACVDRFPDERAMALKRAVDPKHPKQLPKDWKFWTWREYYTDCVRFAKTLLHLDCAPYSTINCLGFNSPEWLTTNNGSILAACIVAGIYTTNNPDACQYISSHSNAVLLVCEGNAQLRKYQSIAGTLPSLKAIVVWGEEPDPAVAKACGVPVYTWASFLDMGVAAGVTDAQLEERQRVVSPGNCCTLIYTSGTTGPPKAVMIRYVR
jgi:long-chain-fatty-acid--CoA ligase ACSBG